MVFHPPGIVVAIVGTEVGDHRADLAKSTPLTVARCWSQMVVRLRKVQLMVEGREEMAISAIWVTDGMDRCRVGFLSRHLVKHATCYDGSLAQVTLVFSADPCAVTWQNGGCTTIIGGTASQQSSPTFLWLAA